MPEQTKPIRFANASFKLQPIEDGARYVRHFPYIHNLIGHMAKPFPEKLCVGSQRENLHRPDKDVGRLKVETGDASQQCTDRRLGGAVRRYVQGERKSP